MLEKMVQECEGRWREAVGKGEAQEVWEGCYAARGEEEWQRSNGKKWKGLGLGERVANWGKKYEGKEQKAAMQT